MPIEAKKLNFSYMSGTPFAVQALKDIDLLVEDGEWVGIIGHTGCGKSTLIQMLAGLVKPDSGNVLLDGEDINADGYIRRRLRRRVGVVFQYPEYQLFEETVGKDVAFGPKKLGMDEKEVESNVNTALELVGFRPEEISEVSPFELSGGQKRKVAIAGVLATDPGILILDEPISGLDPAAREDMMQLVKKLNSAGVTILMVSHNMDGLAEFASRIVAMEKGKIVIDGSPEKVFGDIALMRGIGLDSSEAGQVGDLLRKKGWNIPADIITEDALAEYLIKELGKGKA